MRMQRDARRHETVRAEAGVQSEVYRDFKPGERVNTADGYPGRITAVNDGPYPGSEAYEVTLDGGMGGGTYTAGQLKKMADEEYTAAKDYEELRDVLRDRPDPAKQVILAKKTASAPTCVFCHTPLDQEDLDNSVSAHEECSDLHSCPIHGEHDDPVLAEQHRDTYTDWGGETEIPEQMHRGVTTALPPDVHHQVHDTSRPPAERAHALVRHLNEDPYTRRWQGDPNGGLGVHWTDSEPHAKAWGSDDYTTGPVGGGRKPTVTHIVFHAQGPQVHHLETDPDELARRNMWGFDHPQSEREIPLKLGAPVGVTGMSWKHGGEDDWHRHDFAKPMTHTATTINDVKIDDHGDAPHRLRANDPNSYDAQSTEGDPDPKMSEPLSERDEKGAHNGELAKAPAGVSFGSLNDLLVPAQIHAHVDRRMNPLADEESAGHLIGDHGMDPDDVDDAELDGRLKEIHEQEHDPAWTDSTTFLHQHHHRAPTKQDLYAENLGEPLDVGPSGRRTTWESHPGGRPVKDALPTLLDTQPGRFKDVELAEHDSLPHHKLNHLVVAAEWNDPEHGLNHNRPWDNGGHEDHSTGWMDPERGNCYYHHDGPCPQIGDQHKTAMPSKRHPVPKGFSTVVDRTQIPYPGTSTHLLHGFIDGHHVGRIDYTLSDDGNALKVDQLHANENPAQSLVRGRGVGSALMDALHEHHPGAWVNHGWRTPMGLRWWNSYNDPAPERNVHNVHPNEGWGEYFSPRAVATDMTENNDRDSSHPLPNFRISGPHEEDLVGDQWNNHHEMQAYLKHGLSDPRHVTAAVQVQAHSTDHVREIKQIDDPDALAEHMARDHGWGWDHLAEDDDELRADHASDHQDAPVSIGHHHGDVSPEDDHWCDAHEEYHDDPREVMEHHTGPTDWDYINTPDLIHRGSAYDLPEHVHNYVHDDSVPREDRAHALMKHINANPSIGMHWSADEESARQFAENTETPGEKAGRPKTRVIFTAETPEREHFETDPSKLDGAFHHNTSEEKEIPLKNGTPLRLTHVDWSDRNQIDPKQRTKTPGDMSSWYHPYDSHEFDPHRETHDELFDTDPHRIHTARRAEELPPGPGDDGLDDVLFPGGEAGDRWYERPNGGLPTNVPSGPGGKSQPDPQRRADTARWNAELPEKSRQLFSENAKEGHLILPEHEDEIALRDHLLNHHGFSNDQLINLEDPGQHDPYSAAHYLEHEHEPVSTDFGAGEIDGTRVPHSHEDDPHSGGGRWVQRTDLIPSGPGFTSLNRLNDPYVLVTMAATDAELRFHFTAAWADVRAKAKRIRSEGKVRVTLATDGMVIGEVQGDHHTYESGIQRLPGQRLSVSGWSCGCKWGAYHWGAADDFSRFAGRMCSHALALQFEAQSRGMFGNTVEIDKSKPDWVPPRVVVKYDIDDGKNRMVRSSAKEAYSLETPVETFRAWAFLHGESEESVYVLLKSAGMGEQLGLFPEPGHQEVKKDEPVWYHGTRHELQPGQHIEPGRQSNQGYGQPAKHVYFSSRPEIAALFADSGYGPEHDQDARPRVYRVKTTGPWEKDENEDWQTGSHQSRHPVVVEGEEPWSDRWTKFISQGAVNSPWGEPTVETPPKPYGATSPPNPYESPASAGPLTAPDPDSWSQMDPSGMSVTTTMHDQPEAALPTTDGEREDLGDNGQDLEPDNLSMQTMGQTVSVEQALAMSKEIMLTAERERIELAEREANQMGGNDEALDVTAPGNEDDDIVSQFQASAAAKSLMSDGGGSAGGYSDGDIAAQAKLALKQFSPAEQQALINEGMDVRASNLDRLDIAGTHYADISDDDEESTWLT
jgi:hypothetical protein